jgi:CRISPR-associated protein Csb2
MMARFGLGIRYLNGWAMAAADGAKKEIAEWPPHPDRVFMALAAAWFETGQNSSEGEALRWLEHLPAPAIKASDARRRMGSNSNRPPTSYVPVNDTARSRRLPESFELSKLREAGLALLPEHRARQERRFPLAVPHDDCAYLVWEGVDARAYRNALAGLASKVTHIGHPASFTQVWFEDDPPLPSLMVVEGVAQHRLRIFGPGRLADLETSANYAAVIAYTELMSRMASAKGKAKSALQAELTERFGDQVPESRRPEPSLWAGYAPPTAAADNKVSHSIFDPNLVVLALTGRRVGLSATLRLMEALRGAIQKFCPDPIPEWVCGHAPDRSPSKEPHLALAPLSFVGAEHADGRILGAALVLPRSVEAKEVTRCLEPLAREDANGQPRMIKLYEGQWLECGASLERREPPPWNLTAEAWTQAANVWASVTPVALDRHFDGRDKWERAAESIKGACERVVHQRPREVLLHPVSLVEGVPHAREFPDLKRKSDGGRIHHTHAALLFDEPVSGPILIGAGRYKGYGFFRPLQKQRYA